MRGAYVEPPVAAQDIDLRPIGESQSHLLDCPVADLARWVRELDVN